MTTPVVIETFRNGNPIRPRPRPKTDQAAGWGRGRGRVGLPFRKVSITTGVVMSGASVCA